MKPRVGMPASRLAAGCSLAAALLLVGCTTPWQVERAESLIKQGNVDQGLDELQRIAREHPGSAAARAPYVATKTALVTQLVAEGDTARMWGQYDEADYLYRRALAIDASDPSARGGLDLVARERLQARRVAEGEMLLKSGDVNGAEKLARAVLAENASQRGARSLMRAINEQRASVEVEAPQLRAGLSRPVTLEFRDANLRSVFEVIAKTSGINFVFDRDVRPDLRTTIFVRGTNLDDVIKLLLTTNQLDRKVVNENSILIFPNTPAKQKDYQELVVRSFYLTNADAKQTAQLVRTVAKTRDIYIDEKLNLLVVKDTANAIKLVEKLIAAQDLGEPEVLLEVEVLEVARARMNELGFNPADQLSLGIGLGAVGAAPGAVAALVPLSASGFRWFVANPALILRLKGTAGDTDILANPRIRVKNREKAKIHIGEKVPVITTTSTANVGVSSSVSYLDTGLKLDVEPNVYLEDEVAIKIQLEVSNIIEQINVSQGSGGQVIAYRLGTRNTATTLRLKDGETQMIAGLISDADQRSVEGLPYATNVPLLKRLFANTETRAKSEIVLLITPRIVRNVLRPETIPPQFSSGTEASIGAPPMQLRPTPASTLTIMPGTGAPSPAVATAPAFPGRPQVAERLLEQPSSLLWVAPAQVAVGQEFGINVALPANAQARDARVDLVYDPKVLQRVGAPASETNRVTVEVRGASGPGTSAAPTEVRFRVVSTTPISSSIGIENVQGVDIGGVPVTISAPASHAFAVVQPQGAR